VHKYDPAANQRFERVIELCTSAVAFTRASGSGVS
jgi:hypothetical protein